MVRLIARRHGISESLLYNWRSARKAAAIAAGAPQDVGFVPVGPVEGSPALLARPARPEHALELQGLLGLRRFGFSALNVIEHMNEKPQETTTILLHLYANGLCSNCRQRAVTQLATLNSVPDWMAAEGCYDAEPSIAERFRSPVMRDR